MADPRFFAKLDVGYFDNPKVADFIEDHPRVLLLHLRAVVYCRQHLTDGRFPIRTVVRLACASYCGSQCEGQCDFCAAVECGLLTRVNQHTAKVHDYLKHQDSAESIERRKKAGKSGAAARWSANNDADRNAKGNAKSNASANAKERRGEERTHTPRTSPDEPHPSGRPASSADAEGVSSSSTFDDFWELYPRKVSKGRARTAWMRATKDTTPAEILHGLTATLPALRDVDERYRPHPATWLDDERWGDNPAEDLDPWAHLDGPPEDAA